MFSLAAKKTFLFFGGRPQKNVSFSIVWPYVGPCTLSLHGRRLDSFCKSSLFLVGLSGKRWNRAAPVGDAIRETVGASPGLSLKVPVHGRGPEAPL